MAWNLANDMKREVAQTLQEARKHARSIENVAASLMPLAEGQERETLDAVQAAASEAVSKLTHLYNGLAVMAFGGANR